MKIRPVRAEFFSIRMIDIREGRTDARTNGKSNRETWRS